MGSIGLARLALFEVETGGSRSGSVHYGRHSGSHHWLTRGLTCG